MSLDPIKFPHASVGTWSKTSDATKTYNCIAYANGDDQHWLEPSQDGAWPEDIPYEWSLRALCMLYEKSGYVQCDNGNLEPEYEKIAIYADAGEPTHAALQLPSGEWTSKLGRNIDVNHATLDTIGGGLYGHPVAYLRRPRLAPEN